MNAAHQFPFDRTGLFLSRSDLAGAEPSPEAGMNTMKKALAEAALVGLKHKRKRLRKPSRREDPEGAK